jgi:chemotaxis response regulator CheB
MKQIKVMVVDDSAVVRQVLQAILEQSPTSRSSPPRPTRCLHWRS